jgi:hypothetical protein
MLGEEGRTLGISAAEHFCKLGVGLLCLLNLFVDDDNVSIKLLALALQLPENLPLFIDLLGPTILLLEAGIL